MMNALKHQRVCRKKKIEQAIDERHVDTEKQYDALRHQHLEWPGEVLLQQLPEVDLDFLLFGVDAPILSSAAKLRSFSD